MDKNYSHNKTMKLNIDKKLTILIALWLLDKLIMLGMFIFFAS